MGNEAKKRLTLKIFSGMCLVLFSFDMRPALAPAFAQGYHISETQKSAITEDVRAILAAPSTRALTPGGLWSSYPATWQEDAHIRKHQLDRLVRLHIDPIFTELLTWKSVSFSLLKRQQRHHPLLPLFFPQKGTTDHQSPQRAYSHSLIQAASNHAPLPLKTKTRYVGPTYAKKQIQKLEKSLANFWRASRPAGTPETLTLKTPDVWVTFKASSGTYKTHTKEDQTPKDASLKDASLKDIHAEAVRIVPFPGTTQTLSWVWTEDEKQCPPAQWPPAVRPTFKISTPEETWHYTWTAAPGTYSVTATLQYEDTCLSLTTTSDITLSQAHYLMYDAQRRISLIRP